MSKKLNNNAFTIEYSLPDKQKILKLLNSQIKSNNQRGLEQSVSSIVPVQRRTALLDYVTIRNLYLNTPKIRECVDGISRRIATSNLYIYPDENVKLTKTEYYNFIKVIKNFFDNINDKKDNLYSFLLKLAKDLLVFDFAVIEKVRDEKGNLKQLYIREPVNFYIIKDKYGKILEIQQRISGQTISFNPDDIIFMSLTASSFEDLGHPIIEVIFKEVLKLFYLYDVVLETIISNQGMPVGILALGQIGEEAFFRIKEEFLNGGGLKVFRGLSKDEINFIELSNQAKGISGDYIDLVEKVEEIIYTAFQIQHLERIRVGEVAKLQASYLRSNLILPIQTLISQVLTLEIIKKEFKFPLNIKLVTPIVNTSELMDISRSVAQLVNIGAISLNEARKYLGLDYKPELDITYIKLGNEILEVDEEPHRLEDFIEEKNLLILENITEDNE